MTVEDRILEVTSTLSDAEKEQWLRFSMAYLGMDVEDTPVEAVISPHQLALTQQALDDTKAGNSLTGEQSRHTIDKMLHDKYGV